MAEEPTSEPLVIIKERTSLSVWKETRDRMIKHGKMGETHDELLNRILDKFEATE